jgi:hypothetical protein
VRADAGPQYRAVVEKRFNKRYSANPDYVWRAESTADVVAAVQEAVNEERRLVVTSGGHCLEGFVADPEVRVIIDVSPMKRVYHDQKMRAIAVEAGATVGETFRALFVNWGAVVPLGEYPAIGMGGHVCGGAFGFLCRELGLAADYLYGVEVVTVDESGKATVVVATREMEDPNRDLWWAHTGGGGGNFGIVTRYWFRFATAKGNDPSQLLPRAPRSITTFRAEWQSEGFTRVLTNHGSWSERNSDPDSSNRSLWSLLMIQRSQMGQIVLRGLSTAGKNAQAQVDAYLAAITEGVGGPQRAEVAQMSWLDFALNPFPDLFVGPPGGVSVKVKDALLRKPLSPRQMEAVHYYMTRTDYTVMGGAFGLATYGGRINSVAADATASAQRGSIFDMACNVGWVNPMEAEENLRWVRDFYRELFAETGGVPVPGDAYDGCFINHPDTDVAGPGLNRSGVPWHTLYYRDNYPQLQRIKARWDPRNVFRHALSIRAG